MLPFGRYSISPEVHVVAIDNVECGHVVAKALIRRGYTSVGFLGAPKAATSTQDRMAGFLVALPDHLRISVGAIHAQHHTFDTGRAEMQRLLQTAPADTYFCRDDLQAVGASSAFRETGPCTAA